MLENTFMDYFYEKIGSMKLKRKYLSVLYNLF